MRLAEGPVALGAALMGLGLLALLASVHCAQDRPSWRYSSSEVVIPKKELGHGKGLQLPGRLSYSLRFGGQRHVIHLWRKNLLWPGHMPVMTQDDRGALQIDNPYIPADCFYLGHLEEIPFSMVTIDTCHGGLEGIMKLDDLAYEIAPLKNSPRFEHTVSHIVADINATGPTYKPGHKDSIDSFSLANNFSEAPRVSSFVFSSHSIRYKGHIQVVNALYRTFNNISQCATHAIRMFSLVDSFMQTIDFRYYIFLLTIYNENDPVLIDRYGLNSPIHRYYVSTFFRQYSPTTTTVLTKDGPHEHQIQPKLYGTCGHNGIVFTSFLGRHYLVVAVVNTQQQGRIFGLFYDSAECKCQRRTTCIMFLYPEFSDSFSNCSFTHVQNILSNVFLSRCYNASPMEQVNKTFTSRCGDSIVDPAEDCDCGSFKQCYRNPCCGTECQYTSGSICDKQRCCSKCTFSPTGILCRTTQNICDLPEYCTGSKSDCPEDLYLQNGTPCSQEGYCYQGNCTDRSLHCKEIFGGKAKNADDSCYKINTKRYRFGHCRRPETGPYYIACTRENQMCGRLQCTNVTQVPQLQEHVSFHHSIVEGHDCFGLDAHRSTGGPDVGEVRPGTPCASRLFCINNACNGTMTQLGYDCLPGKCAFRGVCNNKRECHCHRGWDPPECLRKGAGGSQSSGPPPRSSRKIRQRTDVVVYLRYVFGRIYVLLAVLLLGIATNVKNVQKSVVQKVEIPEH